MLDALSELPSAGCVVLDVGCGSGEISECFAQWDCEPVLIDLTDAASHRSHERTGLPAVQGDALQLPFRDQAFDYGISIGVLHHTTDCRAGFEELVRVTRGEVVVMVYGIVSVYRLIYRLATPMRRWVPVEAVERLPRWLLELARLCIRLQGRGTVSDAQVRRSLADSLWTPHASFHTAKELHGWAEDLGLRTAFQKWLVLHGHFMVFSRV
jgi:ubiquinone/menaquinone biosynthesis C-methylase UbiE